MKKLFGSVLVGVLLLVGFVFASPVFTRNQVGTVVYMIDLLNPVVKIEEVYTRAPSAANDSWKDAATGKKDYSYVVKTYNNKGKGRKLQLTSFGNELQANGALLKIHTKGQSVRSYEIVSESDIPKQALQKLTDR